MTITALAETFKTTYYSSQSDMRKRRADSDKVYSYPNDYIYIYIYIYIHVYIISDFRATKAGVYQGLGL